MVDEHDGELVKPASMAGFLAHGCRVGDKPCHSKYGGWATVGLGAHPSAVWQTDMLMAIGGCEGDL